MSQMLLSRGKRPLTTAVAWVVRRALIGCVFGAALAFSCSAGEFQDRFVWVFGWGLRSARDEAEVVALLEKAAAAGLNGAVLSANLDSLCKQPPEYFQHLAAVNAACQRLGLELIPSVFSVGYGGGALAHNRQLAEGLAVTNAPFRVEGGVARLTRDPATAMVNGGFEDFNAGRFAGYAFHDGPGTISFPDTEASHSGKTSLRLENFRSNPHGHGRVMQKVSLTPWRSYRASLWVKTEGLKPPGAFRFTVLANGRELAPRTFERASDGEWRKVTVVFNSQQHSSVNMYAGVWEGKEGKVWLDDWTLEEIGPMNALRRPGTPFIVRNEEGTVTYEEGKDYAPFRDPDFSFYRLDRESPPLRVLPEGRLKDGQRLRVSWWHPMLIHESQVTVCMAEPELYEIYDHEAQLLAERLQPRRVLLNMDEIRMGGTCERCGGRDMAALLGECITRQTSIVRRHMPGARVYIWSDMLDPNHNARAEYYLVQGDYTGSWKHIPSDLVITVWGGEPRDKSLRFFSELGFETLGACYYDAGDLGEVRQWAELGRKIPQMRGLMYTPWLKKYSLLPEFGALLRGGEKPVIQRP